VLPHATTQACINHNCERAKLEGYIRHGIGLNISLRTNGELARNSRFRGNLGFCFLTESATAWTCIFQKLRKSRGTWVVLDLGHDQFWRFYGLTLHAIQGPARRPSAVMIPCLVSMNKPWPCHRSPTVHLQTQVWGFRSLHRYVYLSKQYLCDLPPPILRPRQLLSTAQPSGMP
jgi:hypothetical protein